MNDGSSGVDPSLIGEVLKAVPPTAWERATQTACETFEKLTAPLTESTSGLGRLIAARFERLTGLEKINAAAAFERAKMRIEAGDAKPIVTVELKTIVACLEGAALENDEDLRDLWANLIAQEFTVGGVHPLIPEILGQLTAADAKAFSRVAAYQDRVLFARLTARNATSADSRPNRHIAQFGQQDSLSEAVLHSHGLIEKENGLWSLTILGNEFIKAVEGTKEPRSSGTGKNSPAA